MVDLLDQIGFVFLMLKFFKRLLSIKGVFHLDLDIFVYYLLRRVFKPFVGFLLKGLRLRYEQHHRFEITNEALIAAANLGAQYIADRFLPDKAIDLIDEGSARDRLVNYRLPEAAYILDKELRNILDDKDLAVREQRFEKASEIRDDELNLRAQMGKKDGS